ncbi:hypothetical protein A3A39_00905 [Candidatus Kaiserbacteria bacterium RIFCSPLOWO2_01_FULL_54_13]|uniref:Uncharacterized protein n=1 Tax=Candidatus Kaiserbacteria bacterium RIFCSPLOWO2_01_FULL_54_13 TaxID=1798512 RepID=A0A1F6F1W4_9BACT|nr:MAG: hypothetical protein A3A39_00905 [Candidatus Kaiserbacteria bacterium RIFCSPLOWO2_01_FULL_54_13]
MIYDYHVVLALVASLFGVVGYVIYIRNIFRGFTKPHVFTWLAFALLDFIVFAAQLVAGGGPGSFVLLLGAFANVAIAILAFTKGEKDITRSDWVYFTLALLAILLWRVTYEPLTAVVILSLALILSYIPTFRKSYGKPHEESISIWGFDVFRFGISLFALSSFNLTTVLFPASIVVANASLVLMLLLRRRTLGRLS